MTDGDTRLGEFRSAVRTHFAFLEQRGFSRVEADVFPYTAAVSYTSGGVSIRLFHGTPEFHVELGLALASSDEPSLGVGDLHFVGVSPSSWSPAPGTTGIEREVSWFAAAIRSVEEPLCAGDPSFYEQLYSARRAERAAEGAAEDLRRMRERAESAWKHKRYAEVVALYGSAAPDALTELERKRLSYAEKQAR